MNRVFTYIAASTTLAAIGVTCLAVSGTLTTATASGAAAAKSAAGYNRQDYGVDPYRRNAQDTDGWGTKCATSSQLGRAKYSGGAISVRKELVSLVTDLIAVTESHYGYKVKAGQTWGSTCRKINGTNRLSNHAFGRALDINSLENPQSWTFASRIPPAVVHLWESHGFDWGGYYRTAKYDTMHFEFADNIKDVARYANSIRRYRKSPISFESTNYRGLSMISGKNKQSWLGTGMSVADSEYRVQPGLAGRGFSLESKKFPGWFIRHQYGKIMLHRYSAATLFRNDASFTWDRVNGNLRAMRSVNYPGWSVRHYYGKFELGHGTYRPGTPFAADSLFLVR